jgi:hypothetical protein
VRLANSYKERGDVQRNGGAEVDQEELDAGLRQVLAEIVLPEHVEIESKADNVLGVAKRR